MVINYHFILIINLEFKKNQKSDKIMENYDYVMSGKVFKFDELPNDQK